MKKIMLAMVVLLFVLGLAGLAASHEKAAVKAKKAPKAEALIPPIIKLDRVEVGGYWGYFFDAPNRRAAPLVLAFVFTLENPNKRTVMLDELKFTAAFEDFAVNTVMYYDDNYIPGRTTDYLRISVILDAWIMNGLLLVTSGHKLLDMKVKSTDLLERWWKGVEDFSFPISVRNGTATFEGPDGEPMRVFFEGVFPN